MGMPFRHAALVLLFFCFVFAASRSAAQTDYLVIDVDDLFGLWYSESDWGDFDSDNDLDLLMVGYGAGGATGDGFLKFYRNDGDSVFNLVATDMPGTGNGSVRFGDLDGDNDLDVLICGQVSTGVPITKVFINNEGNFEDCGFDFPPRVSSSVCFGDYDNDGDLDILLTGGTIAESTVGYVEIFRNDGDFTFTQFEVLSPGIRNGNAEFGDYDNDGWLDIVLTGSSGTGNYISKVLRGSSDGTFTDIDANMLGLRYSRVAWVDYNCDGALDIILSGSYDNGSPSEFKLYRNDGNNTFTEVPQPNVLGERQGDLVWGDINNGGYADIIVNGLITTTTYVEKLYLYNPQNSLYEDAQTLTYLKYAAISLGDYNDDGKLDMNVSGFYSSGNYWNELYVNTCTAANTPPAPPSGLEETIADNSVTLSWLAATDAETPAPGLTYNVRLGTTPGGNEIISSMAHADTGKRKLARPGNAWQRDHYTLPELPDGDYYWSVQAIDNSFTGSAFSPEQSFTVGAVANLDPLQPVIGRVWNSPNPFHLQTQITLEVRSPGKVSAAIYNLRGQLVKNLADKHLPSGNHLLAWDGTGSWNEALPSGLYTLRVESGSEVQIRKLMLIK